MVLRTLAMGLSFAMLVATSSIARAGSTPATAKSPARRPTTTTTPSRTPTIRTSSLASSLDPPSRDQAAGDTAQVPQRFAITLNPLALIVGRYGANGEVLFARHHAVVASGYLQTFSTTMLRALMPSVELAQVPQSRLGGELGYRFYSGDAGPTGLFVGPSAVAVPIAYPRVTEELRAEVVSFMAYGAALDVGVQAIIGPGFTLGGGVGVMALAWQPPASAQAPAGVTAPSYPTPHVLPRLLVMAGWAF